MKAKFAILFSIIATVVAVSCLSAVYAERPELEPGHNWADWYTVTEPTCTQEGMEQTHCEVHPDLIVESPLPALGHDLVTTRTEPTCTTDGSEVVHCSRCDYVESEKVLPATGHSLVTTSVGATCTTDGFVLVRCSDCDYTEPMVILPATGHEMSVTAAQAPTCTADGWQTASCAQCGHTETTVLPAPGHDLVTTVTQQPTCTTPGSERVHCAHCDHVEAERTLPMLEHSYAAAVTEPGCETDGSRVTACSLCGQVKETVVLPALGHIYDHTLPGGNANICLRCHTAAEEVQYAPVPFVSGSTDTPTGGTPAGGAQAAPSAGEGTDTPHVDSAMTAQNAAIAEEVSDLTESLSLRLQMLSSHISTNRAAAPPAPFSGGFNSLDAVLGALSAVVVAVGGVILYPYVTLFQWVNTRKKAAIKNIFGGKLK